jgi:hypothetical protein
MMRPSMPTTPVASLDESYAIRKEVPRTPATAVGV